MRYFKNPTKPLRVLLVLHFLLCPLTWWPLADYLQGGQLLGHKPHEVLLWIYVNIDCVFSQLVASKAMLKLDWFGLWEERAAILSMDAFHFAPPLKFQMLWRFIHLPSSPHTLPSFFFFDTQVQMMYKWSRSWLGRSGKHCPSLFFSLQTPR